MQQAWGAGPRRRPGDALCRDPEAQPLPQRPPRRGRRRGRGRGHGRPRAWDSQAAVASVDLVPAKFCMRVRLDETGETFRIPSCRGDMTVRELKEELDLMAGVPFNLQYLHYLDQGILLDSTTLRFHDMVPGGVISLGIWHYDGWTELVLAAAEGDPSKLSCLGVSEDTAYRTAHSRALQGDGWKQWVSQRAFVALYVSSHRGHSEAVQYLLEHGASCLSRTPVGRTALHAAAALGRTDCITLLMRHGASVSVRDARGETPVAVARRLRRRQSERRMFLLHWAAKTGAPATASFLLSGLDKDAGAR